MEFVSVVVGGDDVEQEDVLGLGVQPRDAKLHLWEHLPKRGENHTVIVFCQIGICCTYMICEREGFGHVNAFNGKFTSTRRQWGR